MFQKRPMGWPLIQRAPLPRVWMSRKVSPVWVRVKWARWKVGAEANGWRQPKRGHTPGAKAPFVCSPERPEAEASGYLEANAKAGSSASGECGDLGEMRGFFAALRMTNFLGRAVMGRG